MLSRAIHSYTFQNYYSISLPIIDIFSNKKKNDKSSISLLAWLISIPAIFAFQSNENVCCDEKLQAHLLVAKVKLSHDPYIVSIKEQKPGYAPYTDAELKKIFKVETLTLAIADVHQSIALITSKKGCGSGFIRGSQFIVTNSYVAPNLHEPVEVKLFDGTVVEGIVYRRDEHADIAIIKVFPPIPYQRCRRVSDEALSRLPQGEPVLALGALTNPQKTISPGFIYFNRILETKKLEFPWYTINVATQPIYQYHHIQVDANIDDGNSGGLLIKLTGEIIGLNTIRRDSSSKGLVIPIDIVEKIVDDLLKPISPYLRIGCELKEKYQFFNLNFSNNIIVTKVKRDSPAEKAGLKKGDEIFSFAGRFADCLETINNLEISRDEEINITIRRNGKLINIVVIPDKQDVHYFTKYHDSKYHDTINNFTRYPKYY